MRTRSSTYATTVPIKAGSQPRTSPDSLPETSPTTTTFLLGNANRYYRANQVGMYLQDKYQIHPNLNLTLGLRYDWNGGLTEKEGRITNFDPSLYSFNEGTGQVVTNGFVVAGNN